MKLCAARLSVLFLTTGLFVAPAADWPGFLGPQGDGTSPETGLLDSFPAGGPAIVWQTNIGTGYSAPSVRAGKLVLFHRLGDEEVVEAFDAATGEPRWRHGYPTAYIDPFGYNNGPRCAPLLTTNRCYTFGAEGKLTCLDLASGRPLWQRDTAKDFTVPEAFFGVGSAPLLEGDLLITMVGGQTNSGMVAFHAATGATVWESVGTGNWTGQPMHGWPGERTVTWRNWDKQASYSSPVAATIHGRRVVFCLMRQGLVALDPVTGQVFDSFWFRAQIEESVNAINPVVSGNHIFISAAYYRVGSLVLELTVDFKFKEVWRSPTGRGQAPNLELHWTTPILHDGHLYAFSGRNEPDASFRCVEFATGSLKWERDESWRRRSGPPPNTFGRGSAILADGKLIVLGEAGLLGLFRPNPERLEELGRWQVSEMRYPCWAGPVLADQRVYLRSEDRLICLDFARR
jgi:outer membrane protein assembly factor BamB